MEKETERKSFLDKLYAPTSDDAQRINGSGYKPAPSGFEEDSVESSFDAFMTAAR